MSTKPALVVPPPNVIELLRGVKTFAPILGRITIAGGAVIALAPLAELGEQALEDGIKRALKKKTDRQPKDNQQVLKVKEAIDCVEDHLRDPKVLLRTAKEIVRLFTGDARTIVNVLTDEIAQCIREHALRQDTPRVLATVRYYQRPAKGHGHGRPHRR